MRTLPRHILPLLIAGTVGFAAGVAIPIAEADAKKSAWDELTTFADVFAHIRRSYVEDVPPARLVDGAIRGMVGTLDPHSAWMNPEQYRAMRDDTRGEYVGVGMQVGARDGFVVIVTVFEGGPAADAGIAPGDRIVAIDGDDARKLSVEEVVARLRGPRGEPVRVDVERADDKGTWKPLPFELVRDRIQVQAVTASLPVPGYGHVAIRQFQAGAGEQVRTAIDRLELENGGRLTGLVLDLRDNPGGLLSEAIGVADAFLSEGRIVSTAGRNGQEKDRWTASNGNTRFRGPLVVLVNGSSASASEIVAGALQDNARAVVIGTQTFGKGSVQSILDLRDGSGLKLTTSLYFTPLGRSIQQYGITPDLVIEAGEIKADAAPPREASLNGSLGNPDAARARTLDLSGVRDRQLRTAIEQLHAFDVFSRAAGGR